MTNSPELPANKFHMNCRNFRARPPNMIPICVRESQRPPLPNGIINGPKAAKKFKQLVTDFHQKWHIRTASFSSINSNHQRAPETPNLPIDCFRS
mmetsp:Transcript_11004/g.19336  ORF Transcript_11004/g.19336 Transcript_11004/m.19336 type:complete len:95 (+) Transcript_11004:92-376(+)